MEEMTVSGTAWTASYKGIAYMFVVWSDDAKSGLDAKLTADLKGRFKVLKGRNNWKPKVTNETTFVPEGEEYQVVDRAGVWLSRIRSQIRDASKVTQVLDAATEEDPAAEVALIATYPKSNRDRPVTAKAIVVVIPKDGTEMETAKKYLEARLAKEAEEGSLSKPILEPASGSPGGEEVKVNTATPVERLQSRYEGAASDKTFFAVSAIEFVTKKGNPMVAAVFVEASWKNAAYMESYMVNLAGSLSKK